MYSYENFKEMLNTLNEKIIEKNLDMEIYAIGGFAMMCNARSLGIDAREISIDIDSYNKYSETIMSLIDEVADEFYLDERKWLNTEWRDAALKAGNGIEDWIIVTYPGWRWEVSNDLNLSNIKVYYANVEGLLAMKLRAIEDKLESESEPRLNDVRDVVSILKLFKEDINDIENETIKSLLDSFEVSKKYLKEVIFKDG